MTLQNSGRLAIHRRSDELAFLQHRLRTLQIACRERDDDGSGDVSADAVLQMEILVRERELADELIHTRQIEPLGETLQRRLAMAERVYRDLAGQKENGQDQPPHAYRLAEIERQALAEMLKQWWVWLRGP